MKIFIETMGCQMNRLDSELVVELLRQAGHDVTPDRQGADVVLYNTCSVRDHAEQKVFSRLGADVVRKRSGAGQIVGVLGCMAQRLGEKLPKKFAGVDIVCAPGQLFMLPELIESAQAGRSSVAVDPGRGEARNLAGRENLAMGSMETLDAGRDPASGDSANSAQAFVRVMRGCDNFCSYCIVPFVRGPETSRAPQAVVEEVKKLIDAGRSEITLIGQTVNSYRHAAGERTTHFSDLLALLSPLPGLARLRFVTSHPKNFGPDILQAMRDLPNLCPYIHVPAQSGSDAMLQAMNRQYTRSQYDELIDQARLTVPDVSIVSDFIVGFPGETEDDHQASAELIRRSGYKNSFIFKYSPRPGTAAAKLTDSVPDEVKKRRNNELLAVQKQVGLVHHRKYIGRDMAVLVTGPSRRSSKQPTGQPGLVQLMGRTTGDHIVVFAGPKKLAGQYATATITDANDLTLFAELKS